MNRLLYTGLFRSPVSWAKANREIAIYLSKYYHAFYVHEQKGFLFKKDFLVPNELKSTMTTPSYPYDDICFIYPPMYKNLKGERKFAILTVESTVMPDRWKNFINEFIDLIFVPSRFCRDVLSKNGVKKNIIIAPFGVNPDTFYPMSRMTNSVFRFLFVGTPHYRKGSLELIEAFKNCFKNRKDVELYLKYTYNPLGKRLKPWEIPDIKSHICGVNNIIIDYGMKNDSEIADLISSADVVVQPSYSEGFGLSILEAMAMKKIVISTCWSGESEFVTSNNALVIKSTLFRSDSIQYGEKTTGAHMQKPSVKHLTELLEYANSHYSELSSLRNNAYKTARIFTWQNTAEIILNNIC